MKLPFTPISQLLPLSENEILKVKVRVSREWCFKNSERPGDCGGRDLVLVDDEGVRIQACLRGKLIDKFKNYFQEDQCCVLMNFKLSPNSGNFRATPHPYKIFLTWSSYVKPCEDIPNQSFRFDIIPFDDLLSKKQDENVFIDVISEIADMKELKTITTARNIPCKLLNLQLRNLDHSIIDCVFWDQHAEEVNSYVQSFSNGPIVMFCSLMRINIYNGKFTIQSAKSSTKLFINSDIAEINEYKDKMPKDAICTVSPVSALTCSTSSLVSFNQLSYDCLRTISELMTLHEEMTCYIDAEICELPTEIPWFYIGCPTCFKKVNHYFNPETEEIEDDKFTCDICQKIVNSTVTRYQVHVKAVDGTGTAMFIMFDREVIQLIHKSAYELLEQQVKFNRGSKLPQELQALEGRQIVFTVAKPATSKNFIPNTFKVVKVTDDPEKMSMFHRADEKTLDSAAMVRHSSNLKKTTMDLIADVPVEVSNNSSITASTETAGTPTSKRAVDSEYCAAQITSKKSKPEVTSEAREEGQLSCTKRKPNLKTAARVGGGRVLIPKKETR